MVVVFPGVCMYVCMYLLSSVYKLEYFFYNRSHPKPGCGKREATSLSYHSHSVYICKFSLIQDLSCDLNFLVFFSVLNSAGNWFHVQEVLATKLFLVT